jgi:hypothetical protein
MINFNIILSSALKWFHFPQLKEYGRNGKDVFVELLGAGVYERPSGHYASSFSPPTNQGRMLGCIWCKDP